MDKRKKMFIYFIKSESGHVKIGFSNNKITERLANLQSGSPFKLSVLKTIPILREQEKLLHKKFKKYRVIGEWFEFSDEIKEYIENPYEIPGGHRLPVPEDKSELGQLKKHYGTWKNVAAIIGITYRHLINIRNGKGGRFVKMRIRQLALESKNARPKDLIL